jgi:hypothetical protein
MLDQLSLERSISLGVEEIEARVEWRKTNEKPTKDFLSQWAKDNS